jgi:hypothetical protein
VLAPAMRGRGPGRVTGLGRICFQALTLRAVGMFDTVRRFEPDHVAVHREKIPGR